MTKHDYKDLPERVINLDPIVYGCIAAGAAVIVIFISAILTGGIAGAIAIHVLIDIFYIAVTVAIVIAIILFSVAVAVAVTRAWRKVSAIAEESLLKLQPQNMEQRYPQDDVQ